MRRHTQAARLFGHLLMWIRWDGTGESMRSIGEKLGAPAATVSQVEKGQRALKEPKILSWSAALGVSPDDLHELWRLCQGLVSMDNGEAVVYCEHPEALGSVELDDERIVAVLRKNPDLEPIYRLSERICGVMTRLLPRASFWIHPLIPGDPIPADLEDDEEGGPTSQVPLPVLWVQWVSPDAPDPVAAAVIPLLRPPTPIRRRRPTSVRSEDLQALIRELSGSERERVRGYVEAIIEHRPRTSGPSYVSKSGRESLAQIDQD